MKKLLSVFIMCLILIISMQVCADEVADILSGKQDFVILGSIKDIDKEIIKVTVDYVLNDSSSELIGTDIEVSKFNYTYCSDHVPQEFNNPIVSDNIVLSIDENSGVYVMKNGAYKVDSNEYANCRIILHEDSKDEKCVNDLLELTCYIRANAKVNEFTFDEDGKIYAVYPQSAEQCLYFVNDKGNATVDSNEIDAPPAATQNASDDNNMTNADNRWIYATAILLAGSILGVIVAYAHIAKRKN